MFLLESTLSAQAVLSDWEELRLVNIDEKSGFTASRMAVSPFSDIYLLDSDLSLLSRFSPDGLHIRTVGGWGETGELFHSGADLTASHGLDIVLIDTDSHRLLRFDRQLNFLNELNLLRIGNRIEFPILLARNRVGEISVVGDSDANVVLMNLDGSIISVMGDEKYGDDRFTQITSVAANNQNEIGVVDNKERLVILSRSGRILWQNFLIEDSSFIESINSYWLISTQNSEFILVDRSVQVFVEQKTPLSIEVSDIATKGTRLYILEKSTGKIWTASIDIDE